MTWQTEDKVEVSATYLKRLKTVLVINSTLMLGGLLLLGHMFLKQKHTNIGVNGGLAVSRTGVTNQQISHPPQPPSKKAKAISTLRPDQVKEEKQQEDKSPPIVQPAIKKQPNRMALLHPANQSPDAAREADSLAINKKEWAKARVPLSFKSMFATLIKRGQQNQIIFASGFQNQSFTLHLPDNIYNPGEYQPANQLRSMLQEIVAVTKQYKKSLKITVTGHTDFLPIKTKEVQLVAPTNVDLALLRAKAAVHELSEMFHFPNEERIQAVGIGNKERNARSISIRFEERSTTGE